MNRDKIPHKLIEIIDSIFNPNHTTEEWFALEKEVNEYLKTLTDEQLEFFTASGAGETLYMVCSGLRFMAEPT